MSAGVPESGGDGDEAARETTLRWREVLAAFDRIVSLPAEARAAALAQLREDNPGCWQRVATLLAADQAAESAQFLGDRPLDRLAREANNPLDEDGTLAGKTVAAYRFIRQIGSGGMGQVWLAERADGRFDGQVAIKLLHAIGGSQAVAQRFAREGQLLGRLQHPNIARLLDAGSLPDGQLYLVLEYVAGDRIDRAFDRQQATLRDRVARFLPVCDAIAHAHANLIVHRDLKPSNVLIANDGSVKLLDFGIAKLLEDRFDAAGGEQTELTELAGRAFTPEFAAPEQIRGEPVSTRTDVYSLGVLLFRLLAGVTPHSASASGATDYMKRALSDESPRMSEAITQTARQRADGSAAIADIATCRATQPERLQSQLRGDLDTIIAKALKLDPDERYRSVADFREDLARYLADRPIAARSDSAGYRIAKFARRHRLAVIAGASVAAATVAGVIGTLWQASAARDATAVAEAHAARAVAFERSARLEATRAQSGEALARGHASRAEASERLARDALASADRNARDAVAHAASADRFRAAADAEAAQARREQARAERVSALLASVFREQDPLNRPGGATRSTTSLVSDAVRSVNRELGDDPLSQARLLRVLGEAQLNLSDLKAARETLELAQVRSSELRTKESDPLRAEIEGLRASLATRELRHDDASRLFDAAIARASAAHGADSVAVARIQMQRALSLVIVSRFKEAGSAIEQAHRVLSERLGGKHPEAIAALANLASVREQTRDDAAARQAVDVVLPLVEQVYGDSDARLVRPLRIRGELARRQRDFELARVSLQRAIQIARREMGERHVLLADAWATLAIAERDAGRSAQAIAALDAAALAAPDDEIALRAQILGARGGTYVELDEPAKAEPDLRETVRLRKQSGGLRSGQAWFAQAQLAEAIGAQDRFGEANALLIEAADELRKLLGADAYQNALIATRHYKVLSRQGDWPGAVKAMREAVRLSHRTYGPTHFGQLSWGIELAASLAMTRDGLGEAARIADDLVTAWAGNPKRGTEYARLVALRCQFHEKASQSALARSLAATTLAAPGFEGTPEQRAALERYAALAAP